MQSIQSILLQAVSQVSQQRRHFTGIDMSLPCCWCQRHNQGWDPQQLPLGRCGLGAVQPRAQTAHPSSAPLFHHLQHRSGCEQGRNVNLLSVQLTTQMAAEHYWSCVTFCLAICSMLSDLSGRPVWQAIDHRHDCRQATLACGDVCDTPHGAAVLLLTTGTPLVQLFCQKYQLSGDLCLGHCCCSNVTKTYAKRTIREVPMLSGLAGVASNDRFIPALVLGPTHKYDFVLALATLLLQPQTKRWHNIPFHSLSALQQC